MKSDFLRSEWSKVSTTDRVKRTTNPIRSWIESTVSKVTPNSSKTPLVFTVGDPAVYKGFEVSSKCSEMLSESIGELNGYTESVGTSHCRQYLANLYSTDKCHLSEGDIFLTSGCSGGLAALNMALADEGDTILIPRPGFPLMQAICEERGVIIDTYDLLQEREWEIDLEQLEQKLKEKPKFLLVNNPSNPLGSTWSAQHVKAILELANKYQVPIVADEVYELMVLPDAPANSFGKLSEGQPVFVCSGFAKMGLAPGWRLGWVVCYGRQEIIKPVKEAICKVTKYSVQPTTTVQARLPELFDEAIIHLKQQMGEVESRVSALTDSVRGCPGVTLRKATGAMYAVLVLDFSKFEDIKSSKEFALKLFKEENVNTLPGHLFGDDSFIRLVSLADADYFREFGFRLKSFVYSHLIQS